MLRIGVLVADILIRKIYECSGYRQNFCRFSLCSIKAEGGSTLCPAAGIASANKQECS